MYLEDAESLIVVLGLELRFGVSVLSGLVRTEEKSTRLFGFGLGTTYSACFYSGSGDDLTWIFTQFRGKSFEASSQCGAEGMCVVGIQERQN